MEKYDASKAMEKIVKAIADAHRLGLAVYVEGGKIKVVNTVGFNYDVQRGINPYEDSFAYAEYDGFSDPI